MSQDECLFFRGNLVGFRVDGKSFLTVGTSCSAGSRFRGSMFVDVVRFLAMGARKGENDHTHIVGW
jgi:hypothetical protein